jgi:Predicted nucleotide-binding protein containing TIR-like domain
VEPQVGEPKMKPLVFLGCSMESVHSIAPAIQASLKNTATVQIWNQGFFPPGSYVIETLVAKGDHFDFAVLLFAADDLVEIRGEQMFAARDNTILEAGFFIGLLGRQRTILMAPDLRGLRLPSDFSGLTHIRYPASLSPTHMQADLGPSCFEIKTHIQELGRRQRVEKVLSSGMIILLRTMSKNPFCNARTLGRALAKANRSPEPDSDGWEKAAQYCTAFLTHLKSVEISTSITRIEYTLTNQGRDLLRDPQTKDRYPKAFQLPDSEL